MYENLAALLDYMNFVGIQTITVNQALNGGSDPSPSPTPSPTPSPSPPSGSEGQVAVSSVTASSYDGASWSPNNAVDGIESTSNGWWSAYGTSLPQWLKLDLGSQISVNQIITHFYDGDSRTYTYYIEGSTDGSSWTTIVSTKTGKSVVTDTFSQVTARYIRITITGNTANPGAHIEEIKVYQAA